MSDGFWAGAISRQDGSPGDGIHLLWTAPYAAGYSTTGYDVQRRPHQRRQEICYTLTVDELEILHREFRLTTPVADIAVRVTPCPTSSGTVPDEPFTPAVAPTMHCIEFAESALGRVVDEVDGARLKAFEPTGAPRPHAEVRTADNQRGVDCATHLEIELPVECIRVELTLVGFAQPARVVARRADGRAAASASASRAVGHRRARRRDAAHPVVLATLTAIAGRSDAFLAHARHAALRAAVRTHSVRCIRTRVPAVPVTAAGGAPSRSDHRAGAVDPRRRHA